MANNIVAFEDKKIRRIEYNGEWYFSVVDVVAVLTNNDYQHARNYWKVLKSRLIEIEGANETVTKCNQLKLIAEDGKMRATDCANLETLFRIDIEAETKKSVLLTSNTLCNIRYHKKQTPICHCELKAKQSLVKPRHCEEQSNEAISAGGQLREIAAKNFVFLAMTDNRNDEYYVMY